MAAHLVRWGWHLILLPLINEGDRIMTLDIFNCYEARLHTLPDAPTLRVANHEQLVEHSKRFDLLNADKIVPRFGTDPENDDAECKFFTWGCQSMLLEEDRWAQCDLVWAWIDERPVWLSPVDWYLEFLPDPKQEMQRRFRFTLLGGGQITVTERWKRWELTPGVTPGKLDFHCDQTRLRVTADNGHGLQRFRGVIDSTFSEMYARVALFLPGTPQSIADRVAQTFRLLTCAHLVGTSVRGPDPDNFMALLDRSERCCVCGRALRDHVSMLLGIGPDCAQHMRLPHSLAAADRIAQRRKELLGSGAGMVIAVDRSGSNA
jgi:hypothetical protein